MGSIRTFASQLIVLSSAFAAAACGSSEESDLGARGGDSIRVTTAPLTLDPSIPVLDFYENASNSSEIALTFDDGPDYTNTPKVLDVLRNARVKATFFVNTSNYLDVNSSSTGRHLIERMHDEGHHIGNHTVHHYDFGSSSTNVTSELEGVYDLMKAIVPGALNRRLARAPYGEPYFGPQSRLDYVAPIVARYGVHVGWNIDPMDYECKTGSCVVNNVLRDVDGGKSGIILLHSTQSATASGLSSLISSLKSRGKRFVFVEDFVLDKYGTPSRRLITCRSNSDCVSGEVCGSDRHCAPSSGSTATVYCSSLTVTSGSVSNASSACGSSGVLATQNGTTARWYPSSTSTKTSAYAQYSLTGTPKAMDVVVSFFGDDSTEPLWYWSVLDPATDTWVTIGDNSWAGNWVTTAHTFSISNPTRFVDASGRVKIRFKTSTSTNDAELDRMILKVTY